MTDNRQIMSDDTTTTDKHTTDCFNKDSLERVSSDGGHKNKRNTGDSCPKDEIQKEQSTTSGEENWKDTGWAWIILAGAFLHVFLFVGLGKSFGLFFVEFLRVYNTSSSLLSGILSVQNLVLSISSLFALNIGTRVIGTRKLIIIGGFICCASHILNAYVPGIAALVIAQSVLYGLGLSFITGPIFVGINNYFEKRLGFASLMASVGGGVGSLVMPMIIQALLDKYGLQGALLVVSGLLLNNIAVGALFRPLPSERKTTNHHNKTGSGKDTFKNTETGRRINKEKPNGEFSMSVDNVVKYYEPEQNGSGAKVYSPYTKLVSKRTRSLSESCRDEYYENNHACKNDSLKNLNPVKKFLDKISNSNVDIYSGMGTTDIICSLYSVNKLQHQESTSTSSSIKSSKNGCSCRDIIDFEILKNRHLILILFVSLVSVYGSGLIVIYIPPFARDHNISNDKIAILVTIMGGCDLLARFSFAWVSDSKTISRSRIMILCLGVTGIATMFNPFYNDFKSFAVYAVIYGLFGNIYFSIVPLLIRDSVGAAKYPAGLSLMILVHGVAFTVVTPLLGLARDMTGSYTMTFYIMGVGILIGCIALLCEPIFKKLEVKRIERCEIRE